MCNEEALGFMLQLKLEITIKSVSAEKCSAVFHKLTRMKQVVLD